MLLMMMVMMMVMMLVSYGCRDSRDRMDGHRARVFSVIYHPTEEHVLLTGGWDNTVQFWDRREKHAFRS